MTPLLQVEGLSVEFEVRRAGRWPWQPPEMLSAVDDVSFTLGSGETLGIVGESGCGKTTLARALVGTVSATGGRVVWDGKDLLVMSPRLRRPLRRDMAMIFQDPLAALNPRLTVGKIIAEPLRTHFPSMPNSEVDSQVGQLMERVGLLPSLANRYPHEFSGGQCQRINIARALILGPRLVICDEPVTALDVSVRAQVVNLLRDLQEERGLSLIMITHDLSVARYISHRILVMYLGRTMEIGDAGPLIRTPSHPYTKALIASVPIPDPVVERARPRPVLQGHPPSPFSPPSGCAFESRCPIARQDCAVSRPPLARISATRAVACPYHEAAHPGELPEQ